jgi:hypothetical protein
MVRAGFALGGVLIIPFYEIHGVILSSSLESASVVVFSLGPSLVSG